MVLEQVSGWVSEWVVGCWMGDRAEGCKKTKEPGEGENRKRKKLENIEIESNFTHPCNELLLMEGPPLLSTLKGSLISRIKRVALSLGNFSILSISRV